MKPAVDKSVCWWKTALPTRCCCRSRWRKPGPENSSSPTLNAGRRRSECLRQKQFEVLLLDLSLPDITGRDTFLRARAEAPHLPIVVLTGEANEALGLDAVRHGIQDYLIKGQAYGRQTARAIRYAIERKQVEDALTADRGGVARQRAAVARVELGIGTPRRRAHRVAGGDDQRPGGLFAQHHA